MCCGYPDRIDNPYYPKADHMVYHDLVEALDGKIEALSIEDCPVSYTHLTLPTNREV